MQSLNPYLAPLLDELDQFLNCYSHCNEHQIIKYLQDKNIPPFDQLSLANTQDLFSAHFLCMHGLYHLKKHYQQTKKFTLIIESVRIQRIALADLATADEVLQTVDEPPDLKANILATSNLEVTDPLESYYLNAKHYFETQEDEINDMLKLFWKKYVAQDSKQEALEVLNLPANADVKMVKAQYLRLAQQHHPDKGGCAEMFSKIRQAKSVLDKALS